MLAAHRHAFQFSRIGEPFDRQHPRAPFGGVTGHAAEHLLIAQRVNGLAAHGFRTGGLGQVRQLALAAERRERRHGRRGLRRVVLAGLLHQLGHRVIAHAGIGFVARDVGQHVGVGEARDRHAPHPRIGIVFGEGSEGGQLAGVGLVHGLDTDVRVGVGGLGLRTELVENSHGVFQTPAAPRGEPAMPLLKCLQAPNSGDGRLDRGPGLEARGFRCASDR